MKINHNRSLLRNLVYSLVLFGKIKISRARAKAMVGLIDGLVNKIKKGTVAAKREVLQILPQKEVVKKLTNEIVPELGLRTSGYTRIIRIGQRKGDGTTMVVMRWVEAEGTEGTKEPEVANFPKLPKVPKVPKKQNVKTNKTK